MATIIKIYKVYIYIYVEYNVKRLPLGWLLVPGHETQENPAYPFLHRWDLLHFCCVASVPQERIARQVRAVGQKGSPEPLAQLRLKLQDLQNFSADAWCIMPSIQMQTSIRACHHPRWPPPFFILLLSWSVVTCDLYVHGQVILKAHCCWNYPLSKSKRSGDVAKYLIKSNPNKGSQSKCFEKAAAAESCSSANVAASATWQITSLSTLLGLEDSNLAEVVMFFHFSIIFLYCSLVLVTWCDLYLLWIFMSSYLQPFVALSVTCVDSSYEPLKARGLPASCPCVTWKSGRDVYGS